MKKHILATAVFAATITSCASTSSNKNREDNITVYYDKIKVNLVVSHPSESEEEKSEIIRIKPSQSLTLWNCVVTAEDNQISVTYNGQVLKIDKEGGYYFRIKPDEGNYTFGNLYPMWEGKVHH